MYAVHVLVGSIEIDGRRVQDERTIECQDWDEVLFRMGEVKQMLSHWECISIIHAEDLDQLMNGAEHLGKEPL